MFYTSSFKNNGSNTSSPGSSSGSGNTVAEDQRSAQDVHALTQKGTQSQAKNSKYTNMSDNQLIDLGSAGDQEAKAEYYRRIEGKGTGVSGGSHEKQTGVWKDVILH